MVGCPWCLQTWDMWRRASPHLPKICVQPLARGLQSSTFQLNVGTFCPVCWGAWLVSVTKGAQVEKRCGRVSALAVGHARVLLLRGCQGLTLVPNSAQLELFCLAYNPTWLKKCPGVAQVELKRERV
jgi:hypothetical protein